MKKFMLILAAAIMAVCANAQEVKSTSVNEAPQGRSMLLERAGNTYFYGDKKMNRYQMLDWYAHQNCQAAYEGFRSGFKVANAGWVCFGLGLGLGVAGAGCVLGSGVTAAQAQSGQPLPPLAYAGVGLSVTGNLLVVASIPCLIVGYVRMHRSVDTFNVDRAYNRSQTYWAVQSGANGLGLALHF